MQKDDKRSGREDLYIEDVRDLRSAPSIVFCSDVHFSEKPSVAREAETDWYEVLSRPWAQLRTFLHGRLDTPVVIAGDIFDHWKPSPSLICLAISCLDGFKAFAIPGQHDLPEHRYEAMDRTGYGVLRRAGVLSDLAEPTSIGGYLMVPYPWGHDPQPYTGDDTAIAVIHRYIWAKGHGFTGASEESHLFGYKAMLQGYRYAVFGDNHSGFYVASKRAGLPSIINCGAMYPRRTDERHYQPSFAILCEDGDVRFLKINTEEDRWATLAKTESVLEPDEKVDKFLLGLQALASDTLDFRHAVQGYLRSTPHSEEFELLVKKVMGDGTDL